MVLRLAYTFRKSHQRLVFDGSKMYYIGIVIEFTLRTRGIATSELDCIN